MSKRQTLIITLCLLIIGCVGGVFGQTIHAKVEIAGGESSILHISGESPEGGKLSFMLSVAGVKNLGKRISNVKLFDKNDKLVGFKEFIPGEYVADADFCKWSYDVDAAPPKENVTGVAHTSWIKDGKGTLMLRDLLPQFATKNGQIELNGTVFTTETRQAANRVSSANYEQAIIYFGDGWRSVGGDLPISLLISDEWLFSDAEARRMVEQIYGEYTKLLGPVRGEKPVVAISKFPQSVNFGTWQAETIGKNVNIISADMAFKTQSLQRLHEQLRHEIFHLWMPNSVGLKGNYDWFYEGFALYESLKIGVKLNQISFDDFLDTLSRAHSIDNIQTRRISLIEASKNRWNGGDTQVYARGMLVAFLCDIALLENKKSLDAVFQQLQTKYGGLESADDGNHAVLNILKSFPELEKIAVNYIESGEKIDLNNIISIAGIENAGENNRTNLKVQKKLNGRQKALLDKLGYNNWRKLSVR